MIDRIAWWIVYAVMISAGIIVVVTTVMEVAGR